MKPSRLTVGDYADFHWYGRDKAVRPAQMKTNHLFFSLRMIWHHFTEYPPVDHSHKRYTFDSDIFTQDYLIDSIWFLYRELSRRDDLRADLAQQLKIMQFYTGEHDIHIFKPLLKHTTGEIR